MFNTFVQTFAYVSVKKEILGSWLHPGVVGFARPPLLLCFTSEPVSQLLCMGLRFFCQVIGELCYLKL